MSFFTAATSLLLQAVLVFVALLLVVAALFEIFAVDFELVDAFLELELDDFFVLDDVL